MYDLLRRLLFLLDAERAHNLSVGILRSAGNLSPVRALFQRYASAHSQFWSPVEVFGLTFPNRLGLAAGYDKDGVAWRGLSVLGFGHIEIGTVTPLPQVGNMKPRVFRLIEDQAIINRMGFPGKGATFVADQLTRITRTRYSPIIGVNIGKNLDTPNEEAARDYLYLFEKFSPLVDYLTVNISSPNTVDLRRLQARELLDDLLRKLSDARRKSVNPRPILVKLAPDLTDNELDDALDVIIRNGMDGVIATNTTTAREGLKSPYKTESGGLSGGPLKAGSVEIVKKIHHRTGGSLPIVGVGGIMVPEDAREFLDAGASLVQIYSGLIYSGPALVRGILREFSL